MEERTILFVDDEEKVLRSLKRGFLDEPHKTVFADSGKKALGILAHEEVHVIVTDMRMPEMSGLELLEIVKEKYPHIIRMILSGYTEITTLLAAINRGQIFRFITKPWKLEDEFKSIIQQAIDYYNLRTERDRLLDELNRYNRELEEKVQKRSEQLLAMTKQAEIGKHASQIVHNLNAPLQGVLGFLELIDKSLPRDNRGVEKLVRYTGQALSSLQELKQMVTDILRQAPSQGTEEIENVDINEVIKAELDFFEINPFFKDRIRKTVRLDENLPKIAGHSVHFKQIVNNLLTNAIDAMVESNGTQLFVKTYCRGADIVIDITDTGGGIRPEHLGEIFSPDFSTKPVGKGTGLGLASVKEMTEAYGGRVDVNSVRGQGSQFSITIPISQTPIARVEERALVEEKANAQ